MNKKQLIECLKQQQKEHEQKANKYKSLNEHYKQGVHDGYSIALEYVIRKISELKD